MSFGEERWLSHYYRIKATGIQIKLMLLLHPQGIEALQNELKHSAEILGRRCLGGSP